MSDNSRFLESVIEEAFRRHGTNVEQFVWYLCEQSNMPRPRSRYISETLGKKAKK